VKCVRPTSGADQFFTAGDDLFCVSLVFSALIVYGHCPQQLYGVSTLILFPKGSNANAEGSNRGIAVSSILCKIFDHIILTKYQSKPVTSDLQFGFKANCSTNKCSETMSYYVVNDSFLHISRCHGI